MRLPLSTYHSCLSAREVTQGRLVRLIGIGAPSRRVAGHSKRTGAAGEHRGCHWAAQWQRLGARGEVVFGPGDSIRHEIIAIILELEDGLSLVMQTSPCWPTHDAASEPVAKGLPRWLYRHTARQLLVCMATLIYRRRDSGVMTRFIRRRSTAGGQWTWQLMLLREQHQRWTSPVDVDPEGVYS